MKYVYLVLILVVLSACSVNEVKEEKQGEEFYLSEYPYEDYRGFVKKGDALYVYGTVKGTSVSRTPAGNTYVMILDMDIPWELKATKPGLADMESSGTVEIDTTDAEFYYGGDFVDFDESLAENYKGKYVELKISVDGENIYASRGTYQAEKVFFDKRGTI